MGEMNEQQQISELIFWTSYYYSLMNPYIQIFISIGFNTIAIKKIFDMIKDKVNSNINAEVNNKE